MKIPIALCILSVIALSLADINLYPRGCIYNFGKCVRECEEGTRAYAVGCGNITPEATCEDPNPEPQEYPTCDYSACYCEPPTVRNRETGNCVPLEECPQ